jgi:hypothetical protein
MSSLDVSAKALNAASLLLQHEGVRVQYDANNDGYSHDELTNLLNKENFIANAGQDGLQLDTSNGYVAVSRDAINGLGALQSAPQGVPLTHVLANLAINDGTQNMGRYTHLSSRDLQQITQLTQPRLGGLLSKGDTIPQLLEEAVKRANEDLAGPPQKKGWFRKDETPQAFGNLQDFNSNKPGTLYADRQEEFSHNAIADNEYATPETQEKLAAMLADAQALGTKTRKKYAKAYEAEQQAAAEKQTTFGGTDTEFNYWQPPNATQKSNENAMAPTLPDAYLNSYEGLQIAGKINLKLNSLLGSGTKEALAKYSKEEAESIRKENNLLSNILIGKSRQILAVANAEHAKIANAENLGDYPDRLKNRLDEVEEQLELFAGEIEKATQDRLKATEDAALYQPDGRPLAADAVGQGERTGALVGTAAGGAAAWFAAPTLGAAIAPTLAAVVSAPAWVPTALVGGGLILGGLAIGKALGKTGDK